MALGAADRRQDVRFEVIGDLWGTLTTSVSVQVRDAGAGGLLVEVPHALPLGFAYQVRLEAGGASVLIAVRVRHVRRLPGPDPAERYLAGLEFVHVPLEAAAWLDDLLKAADPASGAAGAVPETEG